MDPFKNILEAALGTPSVTSVAMTTRSATRGSAPKSHVAGKAKAKTVRASRGRAVARESPRAGAGASPPRAGAGASPVRESPRAGVSLRELPPKVIVDNFTNFLKENHINPAIFNKRIAQLTKRKYEVIPIRERDQADGEEDIDDFPDLFLEDWYSSHDAEYENSWKEQISGTFPFGWDDTRINLDSALIVASREGRVDAVKSALYLGANVNDRDGAPLIKACRNGHTDVVKLLIDAGADINARGGWPLILANFEITDLLINAGADVNIRNGAPLISAVKSNDLDKIDLLIGDEEADQEANEEADRLGLPHLPRRSYADVNIGQGEVLCNAVKVSMNYDTIKLLLDRGADVRVRNHQPICLAAGYSSATIVDELITRGADVNAQNGIPLVNASGKYPFSGKYENVKLLLERGADVHLQNDDAIYCASVHNLAYIVGILIRYGANVNARDGNTLIVAISSDYRDIINMLIEAGADVNIQNGKPIHEAVIRNNTNVVRQLIDAGADVNTRPLIKHALEKKNIDIVEALVGAGAKITRTELTKAHSLKK